MLIGHYPRGATMDYPVMVDVPSFDDLRTLIGEAHSTVTPLKNGKNPITVPAFTPCEFDGAGRAQKNVLRIHFGALDVDGVPNEIAASLFDTLAPLKSIAYTTFSHGRKPGASFRFMFPFTRPVTLAEWPRFWTGLEALTKGALDKATKNADRLYFLPVRPPDSDPAQHFIRYTDGVPLDVDVVMRLTPEPKRESKRLGGIFASRPTDAPIEGEDDKAFTISDLKDVVTTLKKSKSDKLKRDGIALNKILDGFVYAADGERDGTLFNVALRIAHHFPHKDPVTIVPFFERALGATCEALDGDPDDDAQKVVEKLTRTQAQRRSQLEAERSEVEKEQQSEIATAFAARGIERRHAYTEDELDQIMKDVKAPDAHALKRRWIIQAKGAYYTLFDGEYLAPIGEKELIPSARRDLSPAASAGVHLATVDSKGNVHVKSASELTREYGSVARSVEVSLTAVKTIYDPIDERIVEAPCPVRRDIEAKFHPEIHEWLRALGGAAADQLVRWLAYVTLLHWTCVALYLDGAPGVGKTLFAKGTSRIWTHGGPTAMSAAIGNFNDAILTCPLVFADEALPSELLENGTAKLREFQQNTTRKLTRKYMPPANMTGATRIIMASNNPHMLETRENLDDDDIEAITSRFLYVKADTRARDILRSWGDDACKRVVEDDLLARHALALREMIGKEIPEPQGRFMIETPIGQSPLSASLTTNSGPRGVICHWLISYLQNPKHYDGRPGHKIVIRDGQLLVNAGAISGAWEVYPTNAKAPLAQNIARSVASLSIKGDGDQRRIMRIAGKPVHFHVVNPDLLVKWAEQSGISNREEIEAALQRPTKIEGRDAVAEVKTPGPFAGIERIK